MTRKRRMWAVTMSTAVAAAALFGPSSPMASAAPAPAADPHTRWVTLVTGDRVLVRPSGTGVAVVTVEPGKGRRNMPFRHRTRDGAHLVVPADAERLVAANVVDSRLFDVSLLLRSGYDDRGRNTLPLIVSGRPAGFRTDRAVQSLDGGAVTLAKADASRFWTGVRGGTGARRLAGGATRVWLDGRVESRLDRTAAQIGAPAAWQAGHTGRGVTVAVLDTGIDATHPDLAGAVVGERDFTGSPAGTADKVGHGTHVAGIITGDGTASGGRYRGVAPDATLLNGKVLNDNGFGQESWIIAGMEWAVAQGARVVNMSLGGAPPVGDDPMATALDRLTRDTGALFVVAAGNSGPDPGTVGSPATAPAALAVGAVDAQDAPADFSSRGPSRSTTGIKPDVTAPGVGVVSALAPGSSIALQEPVVDGHYVALNGTSMATPHAAGAAALLAGRHPDWRAERLKGVLMGTATATDGVSVHTQGAGRIDVARAVRSPLSVEPSSMDAGVALWPHADDRPVETTLTYRNDGDAPVTLALSPRMRGPGGNAPAGMFTVTPAELVVPARGTATARLVTDTRVDAPDGRYEGAVVATGDDAAVRTPVSIVREVESYDVTFTGIGPDGGTAYQLGITLNHVDTGHHDGGDSFDGTLRVRLPKGTYFLVGSVTTPAGPDVFAHASTAEPSFVVDGPETFVVDARRAKPIGLRLDRPEATLGGLCLIGFFRTVAGQVNSDELIGSPHLIRVIPSATSAPADRFTFQLIASAGRPDGRGTFAGSPYAYEVNWRHTGRVPNPNPRIRDSDLTRVTHRIAASGPDQNAWLGPIGPLAVPGMVTQFVTPQAPTRTPVGLWPVGQGPDDDDPDIAYYPAVRTYGKGTSTRHWNAGVFGPSLIDELPYTPYLHRQGAVLWAGVPLFGGVTEAGESRTDAMRLKLSKDGVVVGESPSNPYIFRVPDGPGNYRLEATATRSVSSFSTTVSAAWTFTSSRVADQVLPMLAVSFRPSLDDRNRAPAGRPATFPVTVSQAPGADAGQVTTVTTDVSYDDGTTWHRAKVTGSGARRTVTVRPPAGAAFVSLRATAATDRGIAVEQTIIRAYGLR